MQRYNPSEIEPKWQQIWADDGRYHAPDQSDKPKYYVTGMFPYPSGAGMHTGHFFEHSIVDGVARFRRALGYNVMYPMGWDSFGLPAENYAIKTGKAPAETTKTNAANFKNQLTRVGASIDWSREINTTDPEYYKWTQWIFTQLYARDLAYQKEANQWWCPVDKTVLANEQVEGGKCWRCGNEVVKKSMKQWFFKITDYADALLDEIPALDWPDKIKTAQENWIGRSEGAEIIFTLDLETGDSLKFTPLLTEMIKDGHKSSTIRLEAKDVSVGSMVDMLTRDGETVTPFGKAAIVAERQMKLGDIPNDLAGHEPYANEDEKLQDYKGYYGNGVTLETEFTIYDFEYIPDITVFSTRPDTLFGATFLVLAPEHPLARRLANDDTREAVNAYIDQALKKSEIERQSEGKEKTGVFTGAHAINPASGERMQIWVADYVLGGYGTGAVMGVPAHDERDFAFAEKFTLPVKIVIEPEFGTRVEDESAKDAIIAIVRNPKTNQVLVLDWGPRKDNQAGTMFVGGGMEKGEDPIETAKREIAEETGYVNVQHVANAEAWINNHFYSNVKNKHVYARFLPILFDLVDDEQIDQNLDENENQFKLKWIDESSINDVISEPAHLYGYTMFASRAIYHGEGPLTNSGQFDGMSTSDAREQIVAWLEQEGRGGAKVTYKMRDWLISRQRYWGAPIPIIHCDEHGAVAVPEKDLPVLLPEVVDFEPKGDGKSVLAAQTDWVNTTCPTCGKPAKRETDTMDGYACSSWYLLRYTDPHDTEQAWSPELAKYWTPLDMYIGGDHAVAHLLYVRFWSHVFYDMQLVPAKEPVKKLVYHGLIQAEDGRKMSKSLGNVVDPLEVIDAGYGADALRTFELFLGPINENSNWSSKGIAGVYRFLNRLWTLVQEYDESAKEGMGDNVKLQSLTHATIKKVTDDVYRLSFNTAIAAMMEYVNELYKLKLDGFTPEWQESLESLVKLVQPFAPHMAAELWQQLGHDTQLDFEAWPVWDETKIVTDTSTIIVQVNGKLRAKLVVPPDTHEDEIKKLALADENVQKFVTGEPRKVIYIPGKLVSIVA
ncbi:MAG: class I tRNA ligase family protein [Candidatus Saccharimonas sp.]